MIQWAVLTRAREWGSELRVREGGEMQNLPPANSAPMKARITKFYGRWSGYRFACKFGAIFPEANILGEENQI